MTVYIILQFLYVNVDGDFQGLAEKNVLSFYHFSKHLEVCSGIP